MKTLQRIEVSMLTTPAQPRTTPATRTNVRVTDAVDRSRRVSAYQRNDWVVLRTPPGEAAVTHPDDARALADSLREHTNAADSWPSGRVLLVRHR